MGDFGLTFDEIHLVTWPVWLVLKGHAVIGLTTISVIDTDEAQHASRRRGARASPDDPTPPRGFDPALTSPDVDPRPPAGSR
jgi:hypothetical protein